MKLFKKLERFIQRLYPSGDLWPYTAILIAINVTFFCGGYALNLLPFIKPLSSAVILLISGGLIIWRIINNYQAMRLPLKLDDEGGDTLEHGAHLLFVIIVLLITLGITITHFWIPKTVAGIGAGISLVSIVIFALSFIKQQSEIRQTQLV